MVGVVLRQDAASPVVKKLKLCGAPYRVERNTAFVDGMFTSALEAAKFEGAARCPGKPGILGLFGVENAFRDVKWSRKADS